MPENQQEEVEGEEEESMRGCIGWAASIIYWTLSDVYLANVAGRVCPWI